MSPLSWAKWPKLQRERVRKELATVASGRPLTHRDVRGALYELYPYADIDCDLHDLVVAIYNDLAPTWRP